MIFISLALDLFYFSWVILAVTGAWGYYFAFRIRDAWKGRK